MAPRRANDHRESPRGNPAVPAGRPSDDDTLTAFLPGLAVSLSSEASQADEAALDRALSPPSPTTDEPPEPYLGSGSEAVGWLLESVVDGAKELRRMLIHPLPFRIGRLSGLDLVLPSQLVSKTHAQIYTEGGFLRLRDLGSTNGTFVNRIRVEDTVIADGDVIHFADFEFRVARAVQDNAMASEEGHATVAFGDRALPAHFPLGSREMKEMIIQGSVGTVFQPIVRLPGGQIAAYEALGRGRHASLPANPSALFQIAESLGAATELSRLFRRRAVEEVGHRGDIPALFLNTHPAELDQPGLAESLAELRNLAPHLRMILEIHESALAKPGMITNLRASFDRIDIGLAYDDFGAGQARLIELAEEPPHFLKFDRIFVSEIDKAPASKRRLLASLVAAARELLVETIAEGVETAAEAEIVSQLGFTHAQGFFYGQPIATERI
jgi:EAL domain-containing protein (putative c-di-GMP-specific phosphodiesterase class I)